MAERLYLSPVERKMVSVILGRGLNRQKEQWLATRLGLARSLQIAEPPDRKTFPPLTYSKEGSGLHLRQVTGEGGSLNEDFTDAFRAILSVYTGRDLFLDDADFDTEFQAHIRRGLHEINGQWSESDSFADYLLRELYFDRGVSSSDAAATSVPVGERVERILGQIGVGAAVVDAQDGPRITRFTLELTLLEDLDRLRRGLGKIAFALGWGDNAVTSALAPGERRVYLSVPRPAASWRTVEWSDVRSEIKSPQAASMELPVCVATDVLGNPLVFDLAETPHMFIGGTTGSGKSLCLHALLLSLITGPRPPELVLIDPKAVEFQAYTGQKDVRNGGPITTADAALVVLEDLVQEMGDRQEILRSLDARNIAEANARGAGLRRIVAVIDELGDLFMTRRDIETPLIRLAQKARSAGIHLVLATQRPEAATFPGLLRSNVPSRIALTVQKSAESRIILDEVGAESLLMRGDMLIRLAGRATERAHGCRVTSEDIVEALKS